MHFLDGLAVRAQAVSPAELAVTRVAFRGILAGRAVRASELPGAAALPAAAARAALDALVVRGSVAMDEASGAMVVARGLSLQATPHRLELEGHHAPLFACCAVDAVGIPAALGAVGVVASHCHACADPVALTSEAGTVTAPPGLLIWAADDDGRPSVREFT